MSDRKKNWNYDEMSVLAEEANKHKAVLFGRFSNTVTKQDKDNLWDEITMKINAVRSDETRTPAEVEKKLVTEKSKAKMKVSTANSYMGGTGGGPPKPGGNPTDLDHKFASLCTSEEIIGIGDNLLDSNRRRPDNLDLNAGESNSFDGLLCPRFAMRHSEEYEVDNPRPSSASGFNQSTDRDRLQTRPSSASGFNQSIDSSRYQTPRSGSTSCDSFDSQLLSPTSHSPVSFMQPRGSDAKRKRLSPNNRAKQLSSDTEKTIFEIEQERLQLARDSLAVQRDILSTQQQMLQALTQVIASCESTSNTVNTMLSVQLQSAGLTVVSEDEARAMSGRPT